VVCANLQGSAGYGREFLQALRGSWGFEDLKDVHTVADWLSSRPFVDPERLGLMGEGYGGFLTVWSIGHSPRFRCAVSTRGMVHFASLFGTSAAGPELQSEFLAPPWESHERYWRTSPLAFAGLLRTPLLLLHGDADGLCPLGQSQELFTALRLQGRDVEMVRFRDEGHDFTRHGRPSSRIERWHRILDWFERKL
jgi:dipeptidyl aminopeptidase/acylaminoacyl peptidase